MAATFGSDAFANSIAGGSGDDTIYGGGVGGTGGGNDLLLGHDGADSLFGGGDQDTLFGGAGVDSLFGGLGDDVLHVDGDDAMVVGGAGTDTAVFGASADVVDVSRLVGVERVMLNGGADVFAAPVAPTPAASTIALSSLDGTTGFRLDGVAADDRSGFSVASAGDVNGDGYADLIVGAYLADANGTSSGSSYMVFGKASGWAADLDLSSLDGTTGFRLDGVAANDQSGWSVASAGDVNGDGYADLIVGAWQADPNGSDSGSSYVVFGKASGWAADLDLSSLDGTTGFRLDGVAAGDASGVSVATAGDVNGDGFDDVIVGAYLADPNGSSSGSSYVVFGKASGWSADLDLSSLDGTTGFRLDGAAASDLSGASAASAGDVNGDGYADLLFGAYGADPNGSQSGSSYVVFGKASGWAADVDLSSLDGTTGFRLDGVAAGDLSGYSLASAGDVNGDGYADLIVGAYFADPNGSTSGSSYVVFGKASGWAADVDLSSLDGTTGFRLDGAAAGDQSGRSVASAGDLNGDGYDDLVVGAYGADPNGSASGSSYVVFGRASGWAADLDLSSLDGTAGFRLAGVAAGDESGVSVASAGDANGDGYGDLIVGAYQADPNGANSGSSYVVFGGARFGASATGAAYTVDGGAGDDTLTGQGAGDTFYGGNDGDSLYGAGGIDWLFGGNGSDVLYGDDANDKLWGGLGEDVLFGGDGADSLNGKEGADTMSGGAGTDYYWVEDAGDVLDETSVGSGGMDTVWIGAGVTEYVVGEGVERANVQNGSGATVSAAGATDNALSGGVGDDVLGAGGGADVLWGGAGSDTLAGEAEADTAYGGGGADEIDGGTDADKLYGGDEGDRLDGGADADTLWGGAGNDQLSGDGGADTLFGDAGDDQLVGSIDANNSVNGGAGTDLLALSYSGSSNVVTINGAGTGGTVVSGGITVTFASIERRDVTSGSGNDMLRGGSGDDVLDGRGGIDQLHGADGIDYLQGDAGNDQLWGGAGGDTLFGGDGNDMLQGGLGDDVMTGGTGRDVYRLSAGDGADTIMDFVGGGTDRVDLLGALAVSGGLGTDTVLLTGGGSLFAANGHLWQTADFI